MLPDDGGTYVQAPFENCTKEQYEEMVKSLTSLDLTKIVEFDDNHKPKMIKSIDYGTRHFVNPVSVYSNEKVIGSHGNALPIVFTSTEQSSDIDELKTLGWEFPSPKHEDQFNDIWDNQKGDNMHYYGDF